MRREADPMRERRAVDLHALLRQDLHLAMELLDKFANGAPY